MRRASALGRAGTPTWLISPRNLALKLPGKQPAGLRKRRGAATFLHEWRTLPMISPSSPTRAKTKLVLSGANRAKASAKLAPQPGAVAARVVIPPAKPAKTKPEVAIKTEPAPSAGGAAASRAHQPQLSASAIGAMLIDRFPQCFVLARDRKRPLKTGIHFDLITALPEVPPKRLTAALGWYAGSWAYLMKHDCRRSADRSRRPARRRGHCRRGDRRRRATGQRKGRLFRG